MFEIEAFSCSLCDAGIGRFVGGRCWRMLGLVDMPALVSCVSRNGVARRGVEPGRCFTADSTPKRDMQLLSRLDGVVGPHDAWYQDFCTKPQRALKFLAMKFLAAWPFSTGTEDLQVSERRRLVLILRPFVQNC